MRTAPVQHAVRRRAHWRPAAATLCAALLAMAGAPNAHAVRLDYTFRLAEGDPGLAQNSVTALLQDTEGFVWVGTQGGLHRFDGYGFSLFEHRPEDASGLPDSFITALAQGPPGTLFVGSNAHYVAALDPRTGDSRRYAPGDAGTAAIDQRVGALLYEASRGLWVGTGSGVDLLDPERGVRRSILRIAPHAGAATDATALLSDGAEGLWAATTAGLFHVEGSTLAVRQVPGIATAHALHAGHDGVRWVGSGAGLHRIAAGGREPELVWSMADHDGEPTAVVAIAGDSQGLLWLALDRDGVVRFDPASGAALHLAHDPQVATSLPEPSIAELMVDRAGLLWLGGQVRGVSTTRPEGALFARVFDLAESRDPVASNNLRALHQDPDGLLWLGTEGAGLKSYDLDADRFEDWSPILAAALGREQPLRDLRVYGIADAGPGDLWIAGSHGLIFLDTQRRTARSLALPEGLTSGAQPMLRTLLRSPDGTLWLGTSVDGLLRRDGDGGWQVFGHDPADPATLSHPMVNCIHEDRRGRIWVGTLDGLNVLDPASGRVQRLQNEPGDPESLSGNLVRVIQQTRDGTLWIGTHSGLNRVVEHEGAIRFERIGTDKGLPDPTVYGLLEGVPGQLWISSNDGIARYDRDSATFRRFGIVDGLQDLEFNGGAQAYLADGRLAFGGIRGMNLFSPAAIADSIHSPPVVLTSARAGADPRNLALSASAGSILEVPQAARLLRLRFAALDYAAPAKNRFRYRLEGFDHDWTDAGHSPEATYTNLDAGDYVFRAQGSNSDGAWSPLELSVPLRIVPPWWNSLPAHVTYALLALLAALLLLQARRQRRLQQRSLQAQIGEREERLKLALWGSGDEFWDWNVRENTLFRLGADQLLGLRDEHQMSTDDWRSRAVHPDDLPRVQRILQEHITGTTEFFESEHRIRNARGNWVWVRSRGKVVGRDEDGNPLRIAGTARDISASRRAERERRIASEVLRSMGEAVAVTDLAFLFVSVNPAFSRMTGYEEDEVRGEPSALLDSTQHNQDFYQRVRESVEHTGHWQGEMWQRRKDGEEFLGWIELSEVRDANGTRTHYVAVVNDITDKKRAEQELRYLANYDTLTGLPNRTLLAERLARAVVRARRHDMRVAVLFLDLDRFKDVNDSLGHAAGDRILKAAAARLLTTVRDTDTVARLGGDEFTVVLEDLSSIAIAEEVAQKILVAFGEPLELDGRGDVVISPSIGISLYPDHGLVPTDLLKFADTAMYEAKDRGRNTFQFYTEAMDAEAKRRANMISALRKALDRGEFRLVYQPRLSLVDGRITGVEALLRWHSEEIGEIPPTVFIPVAEETGLILPIGEWVLREACATLKRWRHHGLDDLGMSVNVSVLQILRGDLPALLAEVLASAGVPADRIELEVTESMVMANAEQTTAVLHRIKELGASLAIDDFGTGYSSLVYLKRLPIDTLKIDKEFIGDITTDPDDEAITATVITMAHSLGLNVVAEGVETIEQLNYLREQGCDEIQGFWLSPPLDVQHCLAFIRAYRPGMELGRSAPDALAAEPRI